MYVIRYSGPFGYIKPWTAVRDGKTFSQQFLTPSIVEGLRQKLEVSEIIRHRLSYVGISRQREQTHPKQWETNPKKRLKQKSVLVRGVMIEPVLHLAFSSSADADKAAGQHICVCRNEDILLPDEEVREMDENKFNEIPGFELLFQDGPDSFPVGFNRFERPQPKPMRGKLFVVGNPIRSDVEVSE